MLDALPYGVFPGRVAVGIEVFVDRCVGLFNLGTGGTSEVQVQVLGEVPAYREVAVPVELLVEG